MKENLNQTNIPKTALYPLALKVILTEIKLKTRPPTPHTYPFVSTEKEMKKNYIEKADYDIYWWVYVQMTINRNSTYVFECLIDGHNVFAP